MNTDKQREQPKLLTVQNIEDNKKIDKGQRERDSKINKQNKVQSLVSHSQHYFIPYFTQFGPIMLQHLRSYN